MRFAAIDIGTNTINLLIADVIDKKLTILKQDKIGAKLGKGGINKNMLTPEAIDRGMDALSKYKKEIDRYNTGFIFTVATSAVRNALNGYKLVERAKTELGIEINVIDGKEEARLIYKGVRNALPEITENFIIVDIGGGSCEFIISDCRQVLWLESFETGMARMLELTNMADPLTQKEIDSMRHFFEDKLEPLFSASEKYKPITIVGSSGSFDTLASMSKASFGLNLIDNQTYCEIPYEITKYFIDNLVFSTLEQRKNIPGMDMVRVDYMAVAMYFIQYLIEKLNIKKIVQTSFAIKEGIIFDWLEQHGKI